MIPINVTAEGRAFTIRTGYERHAYLNGMTRGGGFYPATGVLEVYDEEDTDKHGGRGLQVSDDEAGSSGVGELPREDGARRMGLPDDEHNGGV